MSASYVVIVYYYGKIKVTTLYALVYCVITRTIRFNLLNITFEESLL